MTWGQRPLKTVRDYKAALVGDSIERKRLVEKYTELVRREERDRVLSTMQKARERAGGERG